MIDLVVDRAIPLERQSTFTLLGIRFWDPVQDAQVRDGLVVNAWPEGSPALRRTAFRTIGGLYAFQGLPGMRELEYPAEDRSPWTGSPPETRRFVVEVVDVQRRYLPLAFVVDVPFQGIFPTDAPVSPAERPLGCWLFSAPTRTAPVGMAVVRADLVEAVTEQPAAFAVVELEIAGRSWYGVADERGAVAICFPYPDFTGASGFSSPPAPLPAQVWPATVRVRYELAVQETPIGAAVPHIRTLFLQSPRRVWLTDQGASAEVLSLDVTFDEALVLRTVDRTTLWLDPSPAPP